VLQLIAESARSILRARSVNVVNPPPPSQPDADRLAVEAAFHDEAFGREIRKDTWKFYDVADSAYECYFALLINAVSAGSRALEYGCGPGSRAFELARAGVDVNGIDISPVAIELAQETARRDGLKQRTSFEVMDAEHLEFPDHSFDLVCGTSIIHHLDVERAYGEVARVLKPDGIAVFLEALGHNPAINAFRRLTPTLRTENEHPLHMKDIAAARPYFSTVESEHFALLSLAAMAVRGRPVFERVSAGLQRADRAMFRVIPPLRRWSWMSVLMLAGPRKAPT
jgi:ubiquinone/menaquinone biosynthesis C-methylase UbiE